MKNYYKLFDDMSSSRRWHLGEVLDPYGVEPELNGGVPFHGTGPLAAEVSRSGLVLEFSLTSFAVPIATTRLASAVSAAAGSDVQCVPVNIAGQTGMVVLNSVRVVRCIDETRSEFLKWTSQDHRADLAGQYRQVTKLVIDPEQVPADAHFFRLEGWRVALVVSGAVRAAMEQAGCRGAVFTDVCPPGFAE